MAELTANKLFEYTYGLFPDVYKKSDVDNSLDPLESGGDRRLFLRSFIESMFQDISLEKGAILDVLNKSNVFTELVDPEKCSTMAFPFLYESWGFTYSKALENKEDDLGRPYIYYQRKLLSNIGEVSRRVGTIAGIRYLIRLLTGMEFEYSYARVYDESTNPPSYGRVLTLTLKVTNFSEWKKIGKDINKLLSFMTEVVESYIQTFLPFYIKIAVNHQAIIDEEIESKAGLVYNKRFAEIREYDLGKTLVETEVE